MKNNIFNIRALVLGSSLLMSFANAQNITNPGLETYSSCPTSISLLTNATGWTRPTTSTADYFNGTAPCSFRLNMGGGPITAQQGGGYIGGIAEGNVSGAGSNYKDYMTNRLSAKLVAGKTYTVSFYTMHGYGTSATSGYTGINFVDLPTAEQGFLGAAFSAASPTPSDTNGSLGGILDSWNPTKRVTIPSGNTTVYGSASRNTWVAATLPPYTADGTEEYMTIGQWRQGTTTLGLNNMVYYLYDSFSPSVTASPTADLTKSVSPTSILTGGTATYTFTIANTQSGSTALGAIGFTDTLPSGLRIASTPNVVVTGMTGGSTTATAGGTSISVSSYTIPANTTATITVNVTNASGQTNTSCSSNPAAFTNTAANISNLGANLTNSIGNVCLVVTPPCAAGTTAPVLSSPTK